MVTAVIRDKTVEIHDLEDLASVVDASRRTHEALVLVGEDGQRIEFPSSASRMDSEERRAQLMSTWGSWKGLVDTEELKRMIYESRGQTGREWSFPWHSDDPE